jgi:hypothetical protein
LEAVSFLKALQWLLSAFGELQMKTQDLGSGDGVAMSLSRVLLEDAVLEPTTGGSLEGVCHALSGKACSLCFTLHANF